MFCAVTMALGVMVVKPSHAQSTQPQTVSVSPYARNNQQPPKAAPSASGQHVLRLPPGYQQPTSHPPAYHPPAKPAVPTWVSKTGSVPVKPQTPQLPQPRLRMPATASLTPSAKMPQPPEPVVAQKTMDAPLPKGLSIDDVIDGVMKAAPDMPVPTMAKATPQPAETMKTPPADKPLLSVATPEPTATKSAKGHAPSQQQIASLGNAKPRFYWPVRGNVMSTFGTKSSGKKNDGINISAPKGTVVRAAATGLVVYSGQDLGGLGKLILVRHSGGYHTAYAHVDNVLVKTGDKINAGESIANVGKTGNVTKPQLHFEIRDGKTPVNPSDYLPHA